MKKKILIFQRKPTKTLMYIDNWEFYAFPLGKNMFCHWECLLLSVVTTCIYMEKRPDSLHTYMYTDIELVYFKFI